MVPKGKGINIVGNDGKLIYLRSNKERSLVEEIISLRNCRWTQSSRAFYKKTNKSVKDNEQFVQITKVVRGFPLIPKSLVAEAPKVHKEDQGKKQEKVNLKSNVTKADLQKINNFYFINKIYLKI